MLVNSFWPWGLPWNVADILSGAPERSWLSNFQKRSIGNSFLIRSGTLCSLTLPSVGIFSGLNLRSLVWPISGSVSSYAFQSRCVWKMLFLLDSLTLSASSKPSASFSMLIPEPWVKGYYGDIPFRAENSSIFSSLPIIQFRYLFISIYCKKQLFRRGSREFLLAGHSNMSFGIIFLLFPLSKIIVAGFPQDPWPI